LDVVTRRFLVSGKVQGVYFRHSARREAGRLGIRGFARNLPDGSVEVLVHGASSAVEELRLWLHRGPAQARVDRVEEIPAADDGSTNTEGAIPKGFESR
jgi:acylphosphatase